MANSCESAESGINRENNHTTIGSATEDYRENCVFGSAAVGAANVSVCTEHSTGAAHGAGCNSQCCVKLVTVARLNGSASTNGGSMAQNDLLMVIVRRHIHKLTQLWQNLYKTGTRTGHYTSMLSNLHITFHGTIPPGTVPSSSSMGGRHKWWLTLGFLCQLMLYRNALTTNCAC